MEFDPPTFTFNAFLLNGSFQCFRNAIMLWVIMIVTCLIHKELWNHIQGELLLSLNFWRKGWKVETWDLRNYYGKGYNNFDECCWCILSGICCCYKRLYLKFMILRRNSYDLLLLVYDVVTHNWVTIGFLDSTLNSLQFKYKFCMFRIWNGFTKRVSS